MTTSYARQGAVVYNTFDAELFTWTLAKDETGQAVVMPAYADRSVHFYGNFFGATVVWEGTNEPDTPAPTNYNTLTDAAGVAISKTAGALKAVTEFVRLARPRVSGGDSGGTTAISIALIVKR